MNFLSGLGGFIAWVVGWIVLIKLFQKEGFLKGLLGLISCMIYPYIWGWIQVKTDEAMKKWMYIWTGAIGLGVILGIVGAISTLASLAE